MNLRISIILILMFISFEGFANPFVFGDAKDFNAFIIGDMDAHNSDTEGRLAVGGNVKLRDYAVGMQLSNSHGNRDDLVVGGNIDFKNGRIYHGNARSSDVANPFDQTVGFYSNNPSSPNGAFISGNPVNFNAVGNQLRTTSSQLATHIAGGGKNFNTQSGELFLTGGTGLNVFTLTEAEAEGISALYINAPVDSNVLINIEGEDIDFSSFGTWRNGERVPDNSDITRHDGSQTQGVLFNFFEALTLDIFAIGVKGSVLAPFATVGFYDGHIDGQLFAGAFDGNSPGQCCSGQINEYKFKALPEPSTLYLFASILFWLLLRRKQEGIQAPRAY